MDLETLRMVFLWSTIVNASLLVITFLIGAFAGGWVYRMHSTWFPISRDAFNVTIYALMGLFKVFVLVFNLVPYLALRIVG